MSGEFQLGQFEVGGGQPAAPPRQPGTPPATRARQRGGGAELPDWMRNPQPVRMTIGARMAQGIIRLPGAQRIRRRWWAWQERSRLYERYPVAFKIVAFFGSWILATMLVLAAYGIFSLA